ncbi:hypothetical protein NIE88_13765 [Sporolactobacillus shoreicorticis]|uniref:Type II secretion system protein n=1 Tax=Sporolactobacillus shoreicorticis TaxID=1923877 RepID=A0ABW5S760_9BACL|nr:hypothetical protein [Sporolactobacillus shoreicorticis]MCO7126834.1 hypothetical protein [Sporolactobacillus shoreicorticis]
MKKQQDERGLFLPEAMTALAILTLLILIATPLLVHVDQERQLVKQNHEAVSLLRYHLMSWKSDGAISDKPETSQDFHIKWIEKNEHSVCISISWNYKGHMHKVIGEAKK